jgi:hypothetical protein
LKRTTSTYKIQNRNISKQSAMQSLFGNKQSEDKQENGVMCTGARHEALATAMYNKALRKHELP